MPTNEKQRQSHRPRAAAETNAARRSLQHQLMTVMRRDGLTSAALVEMSIAALRQKLIAQEREANAPALAELEQQEPYL
mgnify:CR=1 FL=1